KSYFVRILLSRPPMSLATGRFTIVSSKRRGKRRSQSVNHLRRFRRVENMKHLRSAARFLCGFNETSSLAWSLASRAAWTEGSTYERHCQGNEYGWMNRIRIRGRHTSTKIGALNTKPVPQNPSPCRKV